MSAFTSEQITTTHLVFEKSNLGQIHFGEVIQYLISAGIESYFVDYRCGETTYFLANGHSYRYSFEVDHSAMAQNFDVQQVQQAIHQAQSGLIMYPEFKTLMFAAGCIGYMVWISGKNVQYFGRLGEIHTEYFPQ